jgi:16S rRNA (guanine527-N7)-methyltransferase
LTTVENNPRQLCVEFLAGLGLPAERLEAVEVLDRLYADLVEANARTNLTRLTGEGDYWLKHVADSLSVLEALPELAAGALRVADVGCGAGFPALPLAWANPKLSVVGIEARGRKASFVEREAARLGLENVAVIARQAREAARLPEAAGAFDVVLLRAVGPAGEMTRHCRGLLRGGGQARLVFYKTPETVEAELPLAEREAGKYGLSLDLSGPIDLPAGVGRRQFLLLRHS